MCWPGQVSFQPCREGRAACWLAGQRPADPSSVARGGPEGPPGGEEEADDRGRDPRRGDVPDPTRRVVGVRPPVRRHRRWAHAEAAQHHRRVHPRSAVAIEVDRSIDVDESPCSMRSWGNGRPPAFLRFDNGPDRIPTEFATTWNTNNRKPHNAWTTDQVPSGPPRRQPLPVATSAAADRSNAWRDHLGGDR